MRFVAPLVFNLLSQRLPPRLRLRHLSPNKPRFHYIEDAERNVTLGLAKATQFWWILLVLTTQILPQTQAKVR